MSNGIVVFGGPPNTVALLEGNEGTYTPSFPYNVPFPYYPEDAPPLRDVAYNGERLVGVGKPYLLIDMPEIGNPKGVGVVLSGVPSGNLSWNHTAAYNRSNGLEVWTTQTESEPEPGGYGIACDGRAWVAVGQGFGNDIRQSYNGVDWYSVSGGSFGIRGNKVATNGIAWVAVGKTTPEVGTTILVNSIDDGFTWTKPEGSQFVTEGTDVAWNGVRWLAVGGSSVLTSRDPKAETWSWVNFPSKNDSLKSVAWTGDKWIVLGISSVYESPNTVTWTQITDPTVVATAETITSWKNVRSTKILPNTRNTVQPKTFSAATNLFGANALVYGEGPFGTVAAATISSSTEPTWTQLSDAFFTASQFDSNYWGTANQSRTLYDQVIACMISLPDPEAPGIWLIGGSLSLPNEYGDISRYSVGAIIQGEEYPQGYQLLGLVPTSNMSYCRKIHIAYTPEAGSYVSVAVGDGANAIMYNWSPSFRGGQFLTNWQPFTMTAGPFSSARDVIFDGRRFVAVGTHPTGGIAWSFEGWKWIPVNGFLSTGTAIANNGRYTMAVGYSEGDTPEAVSMKVLLNISGNIWIPFQDGLLEDAGGVVTAIAGSSKGWVLGRKNQALGYPHVGDGLNSYEANQSEYTDENTTLYTIEDFDIPTRWRRAGYRGQYISQSGEYIRKNVFVNGATFISLSVTVNELGVSQYESYSAIDSPVTSIQYIKDRWFATGGNVQTAIYQSYDGELWEPCPITASSKPGFLRTLGMWVTPETISARPSTVGDYYNEMVAYTRSISQDVSAAIRLIVNPLSGYYVNTNLDRLFSVKTSYDLLIRPAFLSMSDAYSSTLEEKTFRTIYRGIPQSVSDLERIEKGIRSLISSIQSESNALALTSNTRVNIFNSVSATTTSYRSNVDKYILSVDSYVNSVLALNPSNVNGFTNLPIPRLPFEPTTISSNRNQLLSLTTRVQAFVNSFPTGENQIYEYLDLLDKYHADFCNYDISLTEAEAKVTSAYAVFTEGFSNLSTLISLISNQYVPVINYYSNVEQYLFLFKERSAARRLNQTQTTVYGSSWYKGIVAEVTNSLIESSSMKTTLSSLSLYEGTLDERAIQYLSEMTKTLLLTNSNLYDFYPATLSQYAVVSAQYSALSETLSFVSNDQAWRTSRLASMTLSRSYYQGLLNTLSTKRAYSIALLSQNLSAIEDLAKVNERIQAATLSAREAAERVQQAGIQFYDTLRSNKESERLAYIASVQAAAEAAALAEQTTISQKLDQAEADAAADASNQLKILYRDALRDIESLLAPMSSNFQTLLPAARQLVSLTLSYTSNISFFFPSLSEYLVSSQSILASANEETKSVNVIPYFTQFTPVYCNAMFRFTNIRDYSNLIYYDVLDNLRNDNQLEVSNTHGELGVFISSVEAYVLSSTYATYQATSMTTGYQSELLQQINDAINYRDTLCAYTFYTEFLAEGGTLPLDAPNGAALISLAYTTLSELNSNLATVSSCISANNAIVDTAFAYKIEIESIRNRLYEYYNTLKISEEKAEKEYWDSIYGYTIPAKVSTVNTAIELMAKAYLMSNAMKNDRLIYPLQSPYRRFAGTYWTIIDEYAKNATGTYETIRSTPITNRPSVERNILLLEDVSFTMKDSYTRFYNLPVEADLSTYYLPSSISTRTNALSGFLTSPVSNAWDKILSNLSSNVEKIQTILTNPRFTTSYSEWTLTISEGTLPTVEYEDILNGTTEQYTSANVFNLCGVYTVETFPHYTISAKNLHNSISSILLQEYATNIQFILSTAETARATLSKIQGITLSYFTVLSGYSNARIGAGLTADPVTIGDASNSLSVPRNKVYSLLSILSDAVVEGGTFNTASLTYYRNLNSNSFSYIDYVTDTFFDFESAGWFTEGAVLSSISGIDPNLYVWKGRVYDRVPDGNYGPSVRDIAKINRSWQPNVFNYLESAISAMEVKALRTYESLLSKTSEFGELTLDLYTDIMYSNLSVASASLAEVTSFFKPVLDEVNDSNFLRIGNDFGWKNRVAQTLSFQTLSYYSSFVADPTYLNYIKNIKLYAARVSLLKPYLLSIIPTWNSYQENVFECTQLSINPSPYLFTVAQSDPSYAQKKTAYDKSTQSWFVYRNILQTITKSTWSTEYRDASFSSLNELGEWARSYNPAETQRILSESYAVVNRVIDLGATVSSNLSQYRNHDISLIVSEFRADISKELEDYTEPRIVYPSIQDLGDFSNVFVPYLSNINSLRLEFFNALTALSNTYQTDTFQGLINSAKAVDAAYIKLFNYRRVGTYNGYTYETIMDSLIPEYKREIEKAKERIRTQEDSISRYINIYNNISSLSKILLDRSQDGDGEDFVVSIPPTHPDYWRHPPSFEFESDILYLKLVSNVPSDVKELLQTISGIGYLSGILDEDYLNLSYKTYLEGINYTNVSYVDCMSNLIEATKSNSLLTDFIKDYTKSEYYTNIQIETISDSDDLDYPVYDNNWLYFENDVVSYEGKLYQLYNTAVPTAFSISNVEPTNSLYWTETTPIIEEYNKFARLPRLLSEVRRLDALDKEFVAAFTETYAYAVGEYTRNNGTIYVCISEYSNILEVKREDYKYNGNTFEGPLRTTYDYTPSPPDVRFWAVCDPATLSEDVEFPLYSSTVSYYVGDSVTYPAVLERILPSGKTERYFGVKAATCKNRISDPIEYTYGSNYIDRKEFDTVTYDGITTISYRPTIKVTKKPGTNELVDVPRYGKSDYDPWSAVGFPRDLRYLMAYSPEKTYFRMIGLTCPETTKRISEYSRANELPIKPNDHDTVWSNLVQRQQTIVNNLWTPGGQYYSTYRKIETLQSLADKVYTPVYERMDTLSSNSYILRDIVNSIKDDFFQTFYDPWIRDDFSNFINPRISQPSISLYYYRDLGLGPLYDTEVSPRPTTSPWRNEHSQTLEIAETLIEMNMRHAKSLVGFDVTQYLITGNCDFLLGGGFNCDYDLSNIAKIPYRSYDFESPPDPPDRLVSIPLTWESTVAPFTPVLVPIIKYTTFLRDLPSSMSQYNGEPWHGRPPGKATSRDARVTEDTSLKRIGTMTNIAYELPPYCYIPGIRPIPKPPGSKFGRFVQRFAIGLIGVLIAGTVGIVDLTGTVANHLMKGLIESPRKEWMDRLKDQTQGLTTEQVIEQDDAAYPVFALDVYLGTPKIAIQSLDWVESAERIRIERTFFEQDTAEFKKWEKQKKKEIGRLIIERTAIRGLGDADLPPVDPPLRRNLIDPVTGAAEILRQMRDIENRIKAEIDSLQPPRPAVIEDAIFPQRPNQPIAPTTERLEILPGRPIHQIASETMYGLGIFEQGAGKNYEAYIAPLKGSVWVRQRFPDLDKRGFSKQEIQEMIRIRNEEVDFLKSIPPTEYDKIYAKRYGASHKPKLNKVEMPSDAVLSIFNRTRIDRVIEVGREPPITRIRDEWLDYEAKMAVYNQELDRYNFDVQQELNRIQDLNNTRVAVYERLKSTYESRRAELLLRLEMAKKNVAKATQEQVLETLKNADIDNQNAQIAQRNIEVEQAYKAQTEARAAAIAESRRVADERRKILTLEAKARQAELDGRKAEAAIARKEIGVITQTRLNKVRRTQALAQLSCLAANATLGALGIQWNAAESFGAGDLEPGFVALINNIANEIISEVGEALVLTATRAASTKLIQVALTRYGASRQSVQVAKMIGRSFLPHQLSRVLTKIASKAGPLGVIVCAFVGAWQSGAFDDPWKYQDPFRSYRS